MPHQRVLGRNYHQKVTAHNWAAAAVADRNPAAVAADRNQAAVVAGRNQAAVAAAGDIRKETAADQEGLPRAERSCYYFQNPSQASYWKPSDLVLVVLE